MNKLSRFTIPALLFFIGLLISFIPIQALSRSIRTVVTDDTNVTVIHTAVGYSTILEFESKPISAVLGDQDSFKLEYVGNSITIKPLIPRTKSNVFIFTEYARFNCQLVSGPANEVDYIVRIRPNVKAYPVEVAGAKPLAAPPPEEPVQFVTKAIHKSASYNGITLTVISVARERDVSKPRSVTLIDFELSSKKSPYAFQAQSIGVKQGGKFLNLESLYLDNLELAPGNLPVRGKLALLSQDFKSSSSVTLVFAVPNSNNPKAIHRIEVSTSKRVNLKPKANEMGPALPSGQIGKTDGKGK